MSSYGQFCPLALASEIVGERWTPLVLRELMLGSTRFNDIHRGVPRMSPALLAQRLKTLQGAGIVTRDESNGRSEYVLTESGEEIAPILQELAKWGKRWLPATLSQENTDPDLVMWDMHRRMDLDRLPEAGVVVRFTFSDQPRSRRDRWLVLERGAADFCIKDPGYDVDLSVETDSRTLTWVWYGDIPLARALREDLIELHGPRELCRAFPQWLQLSLLAEVPRKSAA